MGKGVVGEAHMIAGKKTVEKPSKWESVLLFRQKYIDRIIDQSIENVSRWPSLAKESDVPDFLISEIEPNLRLKL